MTLSMLTSEPKCRRAILSIVSPLCTEYVVASRDFGWVLLPGFATLVRGIELGADDTLSTARLLASLSFAGDKSLASASTTWRHRGHTIVRPDARSRVDG